MLLLHQGKLSDAVGSRWFGCSCRFVVVVVVVVVAVPASGLVGRFYGTTKRKHNLYMFHILEWHSMQPQRLLIGGFNRTFTCHRLPVSPRFRVLSHAREPWPMGIRGLVR